MYSMGDNKGAVAVIHFLIRLFRTSLIQFIFVGSVSPSPVFESGNITDFSHSVVLYEPATFSCGASVVQEAYYWKRNQSILNIGTYIMHEKYANYNFEILENFSLLIKFASLSDEGEYRCGTTSTDLTVHTLTVYVPPKLSLSYKHVTLTNASYQKDHGYEIYYGENRTYVAEKEAINVTCVAEGAKPIANITWMINGETADDVYAHLTQRNLQENRTFDSRSTLQFSPVGIQVIVTCNVSLHGTDIQASAIATFSTYVEPSVSFLLNGGRVHGEDVYVRQEDVINITCKAEGSRPAANLTWMEHYDYLDSSSCQICDENKSKCDSFISLKMTSGRDIEIIKCRSLIVEVNETETISLQIHTYVVSEPLITFNGQSHDVIPVKLNENVTLICSALRSRPSVILRWTINGKLPQGPTYKVSQSSEITSLIFQPRENDMVNCFSFLQGPNITRVTNVTFVSNGVDKGLDGSFDYIVNVVVPCASAILTALLVFGIYYASTRLKRSQSSNISTNVDIPMEETPDMTTTKIPQKEYVEGGNRAYPKPPDLELPQVPKGSEMAYYSDLPDQENAYEISLHTEYYSAMERGGGRGKVFPEKGICFIVNMKMGHIYDRWMGTIDVNPTDKKCVVLSTVSDSLRKKDIQWDIFVKRVLQLPAATSLTQVEGIGIYEGKLYIVHLHMACETLQDGISDLTSRTEVMGHISGILEGLEVIHSYGFLHPGLSTRKLLLTKQGICKLYDFCLSEDASNTVRIKKSKMTYTLNQLAPEALLRDKYSKASDVWSAAIVIWEILSCGSLPFPNEEQSPNSDKAVYSLPETWPTSYKLLRNKLLFDCWLQDTSSRPTILQLQSSFIQNFEALDTYGSSNTSSDDPASSYVHMKGTEETDDNP